MHEIENAILGTLNPDSTKKTVAEETSMAIEINLLFSIPAAVTSVGTWSA